MLSIETSQVDALTVEDWPTILPFVMESHLLHPNNHGEDVWRWPRLRSP
jgi:hypothetical protein